MRLQYKILLAMLFAGLSTTGASALTERQPPTCTVYLDGAQDVPTEQGALLPPGGMMRICRMPQAETIDSLTIYSAPRLVAEDVCAIDTRTSGPISGSETYLAPARAGVCPAPNNPFYTRATGVSLPLFRQARQAFSDLLSVEGAKASFVPEGRINYDSPALRLFAIKIDPVQEAAASGFSLIVGISLPLYQKTERVEFMLKDGEWIVTDVKPTRLQY